MKRWLFLILMISSSGLFSKVIYSTKAIDFDSGIMIDFRVEKTTSQVIVYADTTNIVTDEKEKSIIRINVSEKSVGKKRWIVAEVLDNVDSDEFISHKDTNEMENQKMFNTGFSRTLFAFIAIQAVYENETCPIYVLYKIDGVTTRKMLNSPEE